MPNARRKVRSVDEVIRQVTRAKSKSGAVVKHQRVFVVLKTTSKAKRLFQSGTAPVYHSLVTSLGCACNMELILGYFSSQ